MTLLSAVSTLAVCLSATMAVAWLIALRTGKSGWIDVIWSFATGVAGAVAALLPLAQSAITTRQAFVALLALIWSSRLGFHIAKRTARGGDDPRYLQLRQEWGEAARIRLFWFLQIQALAALVLVGSIMAAAHHPAASFRAIDGLGAAIVMIALVGEALADRQLSNFRSNQDNKVEVCDIGLWGLSRHPNYFFEWLGWLACAVVAIDFTGAYPWGLLALAAPFLMYWLLVHASGIPLLEAHMLRSRGAAFRDYQRRVNAFWPGLPRSFAGKPPPRG